jgi:phage terminase large subunit-like protein
MSPLNTKETIAAIAAILHRYGIDVVQTDQWSTDFIRDMMREHGISVIQMSWGRTNKAHLFEELRLKIAMGLMDMPPDHYLRNDLILTKRRATNDGPKIVHPRTGDGRHGDMAPALALAVKRWIEEPAPTGPEIGSREYLQEAELKAKLAHIEKVRGQAQDRKWWEGA